MNNKKQLLLLALTLTTIACGTDEKASDDIKTKASEQGNNTEDPDSSSVYAEERYSLADLPECLEINDSQLIFVIDENAFYTCKQLAWKRIEIKGESGTKGDKGDKGDAGVNTNIYQNASITNVWVDAITGYEWVIGAAGNVGELATRCTGDYRAPTRQEAVIAANDGLLVAAFAKGYIKEMWTTEDPGNGMFIKVKANADGSTSYVQAANSALPIHCVK